MKIEEILKKLEVLKKKGITKVWFTLDMGEDSVDFLWDDEENDVKFEEIQIEEVVLPIETAQKILTDELHGAHITNWYGKVMKIHRYSTDEPLEPGTWKEAKAIGGFGNSNGIPERGELYVDKGLLEYIVDIKEV